MESTGDYDRLVERISSTDEHIVVESAHALGDLGDPRAVPVLIDLLGSATSRRIKNAAAIGLGELGDPIALDALLREIRDPRNANHTGTLIYALETLDPSPAIVDLASFACDGAFESALMALSSLDGIRSPLDVGHRQQALDIVNACIAQPELEDWRDEMLTKFRDFLMSDDTYPR